MRRKWNFLLILLMVCSVLFGQNTKLKTVAKTSQYVIHMVKFGETLTKISKEYGVSIVSILNVNPSLTEDNLAVDQIIRIPNTGNKKILTNSNTDNNELQPKVKNSNELVVKNAKYHTVLQGQTMYAISKMYGISVEDIQKWNNLKDFNVKVGSQIIVSLNAPNQEDLPSEKPQKKQEELVVVTKTQPKKAITEEKQVPETDAFTTSTEKPDIQVSDNANQQELSKVYKTKVATGTVQSTKGTGAPMTTTLGLMETVYFAMHKTLSIGTIIKIKNLVNNKIVYAKVIGKLPETDENKHVIVRYSLGVKDLQLQNGKCYVQIEYAN